MSNLNQPKRLKLFDELSLLFPIYCYLPNYLRTAKLKEYLIKSVTRFDGSSLLEQKFERLWPFYEDLIRFLEIVEQRVWLVYMICLLHTVGAIWKGFLAKGTETNWVKW